MMVCFGKAPMTVSASKLSKTMGELSEIVPLTLIKIVSFVV